MLKGSIASSSEMLDWNYTSQETRCITSADIYIYSCALV